MKKFTKMMAVALLLVLALALMGAVPSLAQGPNPTPGNGRMGPCHAGGLLEIDQAEMHAAIAEALGISVAEFEEARAAGTPLYVIAQDLGVDMQTVRDAMSAVRQAAIDEALAAGTITQAQAEWLRARGGYGMQGGPGFGMHGQGRGHGRQFGGMGFGSGNGAGWGR